MKIHFLFALLLLAFTCSAQNAIDKQGRRQGHWIKTDKDGSKIYEGNFIDGHETGLFQYYYPNGKLRMRNDFTPDGKQCSHEAYDEEGHLIATGTFTQHNRDGEWKFYTEEGKLIKIAHYRMGVKEGIHVVFTQKGDTAEVSTWKDNHRDGRWWKRIGTNGHIEGTYRNGGLNGRVVEYGEQGELVSEGNYVDGSRHGSYRYYENGRMSIDETWERGILTDRKVLVLQPEATYVSIFKIACMVPKGKNQVTIYTRNGESVQTYEPFENLYARIGNETFTLANREGRIMIATDCVMGLKKDAEGRDVLDTEPALPVDIFPDEDCKKMVESLQREGFEN